MIHIITNTYSFNLFVLPTGRTMGSVMNFGYSYAGATGNMLSRTDNTRSLTETFSYDNLDRLVSSSGNTADTRTFTYANNGNITQMGGLGTLSHNDSGHPYRVTGGDVTGMESLSYSAAYTAFDRPAVLSSTDQESGAITNMAFTYDAAHKRVRMTSSFEDESKAVRMQTTVNRWYLGGRYELEETVVQEGEESRSYSKKERLYLGGDAYSAPVVAIRTTNSGNGTYYNIGRDVQGSITHIATMSGTLVAEYSYDPWGRLRNPATHALYNILSVPDLMLGRGYTGHEYIPEAGLWNANARLYDPFLGCFLSPDPYVQAPDFTQNLNRYAYALNNPLKYSDESGEFLTWGLSSGGASIGLNFSIVGIPLGFGLNTGWAGGFSLGIYGEIGVRAGGMGVAMNHSLDYNFSKNYWSFTSSANIYASLGLFSANAGITLNDFGASSSAGIGIGDGHALSGGSFGFNYSNGRLSANAGGYYDYKPIYYFCRSLGSSSFADDPIAATDANLLELQQLWYPDAPMDHIVNFSVENVSSSVLEIFENNPLALAQTAPQFAKTSLKLTGKSSVYFSKRAFSSKFNLFITMGHEFVHVCNYIYAAEMGLTKDKVAQGTPFYEFTEFLAYSYQNEYTNSNMNSFDMKKINSIYSIETIKAMSYKLMPWYKTRSFSL